MTKLYNFVSGAYEQVTSICFTKQQQGGHSGVLVSSLHDPLMARICVYKLTDSLKRGVLTGKPDVTMDQQLSGQVTMRQVFDQVRAKVN